MNKIPNPFGQYQLIELLGEGSFSTVYRAADGNSTREVALKVLHPDVTIQARSLKEFSKCIEQSAALNHPNIIKIYDWGTYENHPYIVMELMKGKSFDQLLGEASVAKNQEPLPLNKTLPILSQIANALDYAHKEGITHQDIKPSNLFIEKSGHLTVTDLGLIDFFHRNKMLFGGMDKAGTLAYMAPEQVEPHRASQMTGATDVYSLGIFAYRLLTGDVPFADNGLATLNAHLNLEPPDPCSQNYALPSPVGDVLQRALAKKPSARYQTASAFVLALRKASIVHQEVPFGVPYPALIMTVAGLIFTFMLSSMTLMLNQPSLPSEMPQVNAAGISLTMTTTAIAMPSETATALATPTIAQPTATINQSIALAEAEATATTPSIATQKQATATNSPTKSPTVTSTESRTATPTKSSTESPTATLTESPTATPTESPTATPTESPTVAPTETATVTQQPSPIPTQPPTQIPTPIPSPSPIPTELPTVTQRAPTPIPLPSLSPVPPTRAATPIPLPTFSPIPPTLPAPTETAPAPTATVDPYPVPILLEPPSRAIVNQPTLFRWRWDGQLGRDEYFDVRVWREGEPHFGVTWTTETEYLYDPRTKGDGQFFWSVAVIRGQGGQREMDLTEEAPAQFFTVGN